MNSKLIARMLGVVGISLVVHAVSAQLWGFRADERHLFLTVAVVLLFWEFSARFKRYSLTIGVALLLVCGASYPFLTEGPLRIERQQHAAETVAQPVAPANTSAPEGH